jgi:hypothetical protein
MEQEACLNAGKAVFRLFLRMDTEKWRNRALHNSAFKRCFCSRKNKQYAGWNCTLPENNTSVFAVF